jgi:hypothetical protein
MIQANEARFSNWFFHTNCICNPYMQLDFQLMRNEITHDGKCYPELEGIPLTPEILEKCGKRMEPPNEDFYFVGKYTIKVKINNIAFIIAPAIYIDIEYLHQLQNLYHALTGEELTISINQ